MVSNEFIAYAKLLYWNEKSRDFDRPITPNSRQECMDVHYIVEIFIVSQSKQYPDEELS